MSVRRLLTLIVDDEAVSRAALTHLAAQTPFLDVLEPVSDPFAAIAVLQEQPVDLLLLDIEMPQLSGLELLRSLQRRPYVILITAQSQYAVEAFELQAQDYLVKPVEAARFLQATQRAWQQLATEATPPPTPAGDLFIRVDQQHVRVPLNDIRFVQADGDYVRIHTKSQTYATHATMTEVEARLPAERFFRVHRSYLVNLAAIDVVQEQVLVIGQKAIPISKQRRDALQARLNLL